MSRDVSEVWSEVFSNFVMVGPLLSGPEQSGHESGLIWSCAGRSYDGRFLAGVSRAGDRVVEYWQVFVVSPAMEVVIGVW